MAISTDGYFIMNIMDCMIDKPWKTWHFMLWRFWNLMVVIISWWRCRRHLIPVRVGLVRWNVLEDCLGWPTVQKKMLQMIFFFDSVPPTNLVSLGSRWFELRQVEHVLLKQWRVKSWPTPDGLTVHHDTMTTMKTAQLISCKKRYSVVASPKST